MPVDFAKTAEDYRRHRAEFPSSLFDRLAAHASVIADNAWSTSAPGLEHSPAALPAAAAA